MKGKVYLAKSNRSNPDDVSRIRKILSNYNVEVVEFKGGRYTHDQLLECDYLVIVPDLSEVDKEDGFIPWGKGLHEQYFAFKSEHLACDIFLVVESNDKWNYVTQIVEVDVAEEDDYVNYSDACFDRHKLDDLESVLESRLGHKVVGDTITKNKSKYLLIGSK